MPDACFLNSAGNKLCQRCCRAVRPLLLLGLFAVASVSPASAERLALVIGNSAYTHIGKLNNPRNDAVAIARELKSIGFTLVGKDGGDSDGPVLDLTDRDDAFFKTLNNFIDRTQGADLALLYYAGHGMQVDGHSFMLPVDATRDGMRVLKRNAINLERDVLGPLDGQAGLSVVVFDACREIPHLNAVGRTRSSQPYRAYRGMMPTTGRERSLIVAYAGASGQLVKDGNQRDGHSPYTKVLLEQLRVASQDEIGRFFRRVAYRFGQLHRGQSPELLVGAGVPPDRYYFRSPLPHGHLSITSHHEPIAISLDARLLGTAIPGRPLLLPNMPAGRHTITATASGRQQPLTVLITPGVTNIVHLPLRNAPPSPTGSLTITTRPSGATIHVDGRRRGTTPLTLHGLPTGELTVHATLDNHPPRKQLVLVRANRLTELPLTLEREPDPAVLKIASEPAGAAWFLDDVYVGMTPDTLTNITAGKHKLTIKHPGFLSWQKEISIASGRTPDTRTGFHDYRIRRRPRVVIARAPPKVSISATANEHMHPTAVADQTSVTI